MKKIMLLMGMVLLLSGCKEEIKDEPVIETDPNIDALVDFELSNEVYEYLEDKEIEYVGEESGYIFISYIVNEIEDEMICINPAKEIQFTVSGGYASLSYSGKYDSQFLIEYRLIDEESTYGVFDETGELLFSFGQMYHMQTSTPDDSWSTAAAYIGNGAFVYIEMPQSNYAEQLMKLVKHDSDGTTVLFEFLAHPFRLFAGYIEDDSFMIYYGSEFESAKMARINIDGTVLYDQPTTPGWVTFVGDRFIVSRSNQHTIYDLNHKITGSFYARESIREILDYDGYMVFVTYGEVCTMNDDGSFLCEYEEQEIEEEEVLYSFADGSKLVKNDGLDNKTNIELVSGEERVLLTSHNYIRNVIVENDLIYVSWHTFTKYYLEVFDLNGNIVTEEAEFPGALIAFKDDGNYIVNSCEPTAQAPYISEDLNCIKEVTIDGNIVWELENLSSDAVIKQFDDNLIITTGHNICSVYFDRHQPCELIFVSFDGGTIFDVNDDYKNVTYLYQEGDYIYICAVADNEDGDYNINGVIFKLDSSLNIVGEYDIAYATDTSIYYLDEDSLVRYTMQR